MGENYGSMNDETLAALIQAGQPEAFAALSERYLWLLRARASLFEGPAAPEREDLLQEGLLGLYAAALSFSGEKGASFRTYAGVCVQNRMADAARRHGSAGNRVLTESLSLESGAARELEGNGSPEELLELRERLRGLLSRLENRLTPLERQVLTLTLAGCSREEIADRGDMTLKTYDNALYRLRKKLREDAEKT